MGGRGASFHGGVTSSMVSGAARAYRTARSQVLSMAREARTLSPGARGKSVARSIMRQNAGSLRAMKGRAYSLKNEYNSGSMSLFGGSFTRSAFRRVDTSVRGQSDLRKLRNTVAAERKVAAREQKRAAAEAKRKQRQQQPSRKTVQREAENWDDMIPF